MQNDSGSGGPVVALCGGIGGAKLALGLSRVVAGDRLVIAVNTGDDFEHLGLHIAPDIDTVTYTLAGIANEEIGWGRAGESWNFMAALGALGGETWFSLGDKDLALHVERTRRLHAGEALSAITADICARLGIAARVLPMSDDPVRTTVETDEGTLPFQTYFVARRCAPAVKAVTFAGADAAAIQPGLLAALGQPDLRCVVICPSNPYLSIDPMLAIPGLRDALHAAKAPVVAVSPVVGGGAVKGPMAKVMGELGIEVGHGAIADHYAGLIDALVVDQDGGGIDGDISVLPANTMMQTMDDKTALARTVLDLADRLAVAGTSLTEQAV